MYLLIWMAEWVEPINWELVGVDVLYIGEPTMEGNIFVKSTNHSFNCRPIARGVL